MKQNVQYISKCVVLSIKYLVSALLIRRRLMSVSKTKQYSQGATVILQAVVFFVFFFLDP